jgi:starch-binding outer membrane protein, SusD/RagB family
VNALNCLFDIEKHHSISNTFNTTIMKTRITRRLLLLLCLTAHLCVACTAFVQNIAPSPYGLTEEFVNTEEQVPALIVGVQGNFDQSYGSLSLTGSMLSDELFTNFALVSAGLNVFSTTDGSNFSSVRLNNRAFETEYAKVAKVRLLADTLLTRLSAISFGAGEKSQRLRDEAFYTAYFYGAAARYLLATNFGLRQDGGGGGTINNSAFIPSGELYRDALARLDSAKRYTAEGSPERRILETFIARIYLLTAQYASAEAAAGRGMRASDRPLNAVFARDNDPFYNLFNPWISYYNRNPNNEAFTDKRFPDYIAQDSLEARRVRVLRRNVSGMTLYNQGRYTRNDSPIPFLTWQENELMLAECKIRRGVSGLEHINRVRAFYGLKALETATLETIITERDKELFCTGMRLPDQRRFNRWHLDAGTWQYLPIPQSERDLNPNLGG